MPTPFGALRPVRLNFGPVGTDNQSMTATPRLLRRHAAALLRTPTAVVVLDLADGAVDLEPNPGDAIWDSPAFVVLATHADALAAAKVAAGADDFLGRLTEELNAGIAELAAAGELPTAEEAAAVVAEIAQLHREHEARLMGTVLAFPGGGAA